MANTLLHTLLGYLHRLDHTDIDNPSDAILLRRFLDRDEAAFATLLGRHGPMVLGVCRRLLRQEQEAEDAFQATFLVLANKARSLTGVASLGGWLHGVALRVSRKARTHRQRREDLHQKAIERAMVSRANGEREGDLMVALDEELDRLPSRYKQPLILCHLESKTVEEASQQLGWKEGTVRGLLYRGRELLRKRLAERGLTPLEKEPVGACPPVPAGLVQATLTSAVGIVQGTTMVAGPAVVLAQGVLHTMMLTRMLILTGALAFVGAGALGTLALGQNGDKKEPAKELPKASVPPTEKGKTDEEKLVEAIRAAHKAGDWKTMLPSILKTEAIADAPGDNEMSKLLKQHYNASLELTKADYQSFVASVADSTLGTLLNDSRRLVTAGLEIHARKQDKLAFLKQMAELSLDLDTIINDSFQAGRTTVADVKRSEQFKLEIKILMLKTKGE